MIHWIANIDYNDGQIKKCQQNSRWCSLIQCWKQGRWWRWKVKSIQALLITKHKKSHLTILLEALQNKSKVSTFKPIEQNVLSKDKYTGKKWIINQMDYEFLMNKSLNISSNIESNISGFGYDPDTPGSKSILWKTPEELQEPKSITVFDWTTTKQQIYFDINASSYHETVDTTNKVDTKICHI